MPPKAYFLKAVVLSLPFPAMPTTIPANYPREIEAGNTVKFRVTSRQYPPAEWALLFVLSRYGKKIAEIAGEARADEWLVTILPGITADVLPGATDFAAYVSKAGERYTLKTGALAVTPNFGTDRAQTTAETLLTALEGAILKLSRGTNKLANFNGQQYEKKDLGSLFKVRDRLQAEIAAERAGTGGKPNFQTIVTRF